MKFLNLIDIIISGINVLCRFAENGEIVGNKFPKDKMDSNNLELAYRYKIYGEKWGCVRTDVLSEFPYKETDEHLPPNYVWFNIARRYKVRCVNDVLRLYYRDQANHIAEPKRFSKLTRKSSRYIYYLWHFNTNLDYLMYDKKSLAHAAMSVWRLGFHLKKSTREILSEVEDPKKKILLLSFLTTGKAAAIADKVLGRA